MDLEYIKEFVVFAQYLNVTKAAAATYTSKSVLSKHIKKLEGNVGFQLVEHKGKKCNLTQEGECFYNAFVEMLSVYDGAAKKCESMRRARREFLYVQEPSYSDATAMALYTLISHVKNVCGGMSVQYRNPQRKNQIDELKDGKMDLILLYRRKGANVLEGEDDFLIKSLAEDSISIWCSRDHFLAGKDNVTFDDLRATSILYPNDVYAPLREVLISYGTQFGFRPNFMMVASEAPSTFLFLQHPESVYIVPASSGGDLRIRARSDMVQIPLEGGSVRFCTYAVLLKSRARLLRGAVEMFEGD